MKEIKFYQCEYCKEKYKNAKEAYACEQNHVLPFKISQSIYVSRAQCPSGYPDLIEVEMADGKICTYHFNFINGEEDNDEWEV